MGHTLANIGFFAGVVLIAVVMVLKASAALCLPFVVWLVVNRAGESVGAKVRAFLLAGVGGAVETVAILAIIQYRPVYEIYSSKGFNYQS